MAPEQGILKGEALERVREEAAPLAGGALAVLTFPFQGNRVSAHAGGKTIALHAIKPGRPGAQWEE